MYRYMAYMFMMMIVYLHDWSVVGVKWVIMVINVYYNDIQYYDILYDHVWSFTGILSRLRTYLVPPQRVCFK